MSVTFERSSMNEKDTFNQKMNENNHNNHVNGYEKYNIISITFEKSSMNEKDTFSQKKKKRMKKIDKRIGPVIRSFLCGCNVKEGNLK